jgi:hypothetical protein
VQTDKSDPAQDRRGNVGTGVVCIVGARRLPHHADAYGRFRPLPRRRKGLMTCRFRLGPTVIPAKAGIQICTSDQDVGKTDLINELDSGSSPE